MNVHLGKIHHSPQMKHLENARTILAQKITERRTFSAAFSSGGRFNGSEKRLMYGSLIRSSVEDKRKVRKLKTLLEDCFTRFCNAHEEMCLESLSNDNRTCKVYNPKYTYYFPDYDRDDGEICEENRSACKDWDSYDEIVGQKFFGCAHYAYPGLYKKECHDTFLFRI